MYPNYIYYETPKLVNVGLKTNKKVSQKEIDRYNREERYYSTVQEILFSEIILDREIVQFELNSNYGIWTSFFQNHIIRNSGKITTFF